MSYTLRNAKVKYMDDVSPSTMDDGEYAQTLRFTTDQLPEIAYWQPGEEYYLVIKVKETEHSIEKKGKEVSEEANFEVVEVGAISDDSGENYEGKVKSKLNLK